MTADLVDTALVIGVGNRDRGDDAVGPMVADEIRARGSAETQVMEGDLSDLALCWGSDQHVVIIDAMQSGAPAGHVVQIEAGSPDSNGQNLPSDGRLLSSHGIGLGAAVELARCLDRMPRRLVILGVEGAQFELLAGLSPEVAAAFDSVIDRVEQLIASQRGVTGHA